MARRNRYPGLTKEQRSQLKALLREVASLPTDNLLRECFRLRSVDLATEEGKSECDHVMGSIWAYERLTPYMMALRYFSGEREDIGRQIYDYMQVPYPIQDSEVPRKAYASLLAANQAGVQELTFHFFCISVHHVLTYLKIAAEAAGHELSKEDYDFLDHYRDLRDYYEHFYNRLPGRLHESAVISKTSSDFSYRVQGGLKVDAQERLLFRVQQKDANGKRMVDGDGNPVLVEKAFDVTSRGMRKIDEIVKRNWEDIRRKALIGLREHFIQNPDNIPSPEDVQFTVMTSAGGYEPEEDDF